MAETTADVKRDIEMTRERISNTLAQLEQKTNVLQIVKDHPWPALAVAFGAGVLLSGSRADVKAAGATLVATRGASSRVGNVLDDVVSQLMTGLHAAFQHKIEGLVNEVKEAIGAPVDGSSGQQQGGAQHGGAQRAYGGGSTGGGSTGGGSATAGGMGGGTTGSGTSGYGVGGTSGTGGIGATTGASGTASSGGSGMGTTGGTGSTQGRGGLGGSSGAGTTGSATGGGSRAD